MFFNDKKKTASIIVAKLDKPGSHEQKAEESFGDENPGLQSAAEDILQAVKDGSPSALADALKAFLACQEGSSEDEDESNDSEWGE